MSWVPTGSLNTARSGHTATLLKSGKVLVVGGSGDNSAELFDPITGAWSYTGSLTTARASFTATLLLDGRVLVAGGYSPVPPYSSIDTAELYDPDTGSWTLTGSLNVGRTEHTASLLRDGTVLVAGGWDENELASAELFDPATGTWKQIGSLGNARYGHTATLLQDGRLLVAGGSAGEDVLSYSVANAELYDPASNAWSAAAPGYYWYLSVLQTATLLPDGKVLVAGGDDGIPAAELFDPLVGSWNATGSLAIARYGHSATLLPTGGVLVAGGARQEGRPPRIAYDNLDSAEIYDATAGAWSGAANLGNPRSFHTATLLQDGRVLVAGGNVTVPPYADIALNSAELYGPASLPGARTGSVSVIEFYNLSRDHYFNTWLPNEIAILDAGVQIEGWQRTGYSFLAYPTAQTGTSDICRFYIPPAEGDSHFYGRGSAECAAVAKGYADFILEDAKFMAMALPIAGVCPVGTNDVYRVFDKRPDVNHRYTTDKAVRAQMVARGWLAEGDGPNQVVMCAPN
jgi:hypothetical protein